MCFISYKYKIPVYSKNRAICVWISEPTIHTYYFKMNY